ncbi:XRE family transcriptional regulator [Sporosarcina sp. P35]|nr:XRE family transcriptional regulator [Sporosarcina sp. P35]
MLGKRMKLLRGNKTQEEMSKLLGLSRASYSHYENNRVEPDTEMLKKIADIHNVTVDYLLGRTSSTTHREVNQKNYKIPFHRAAQITEILNQKRISASEFRRALGMSEDDFFVFRGGNDFKITEKQAKVIEDMLGIPKENLEDDSFTETVMGREITLSEEDVILFNELKKYPILFHDLASDPERKVRELLKMYKMKKMFLEDNEEELGDGFGDLED